MTTTAAALPGTSRGGAIREALTGAGGPAVARRAVLEDAPALVRAVLRGMLRPASGAEHVGLRPVRSVLRPHRKLTVTFEASVPGDPLQTRLVVASWTPEPSGGNLEDGVGGLEGEARRRALKGPFLRLHDREPRMRLLVAPLDPAFPQLVRLHDTAYLAPLLAGPSSRAEPRGVAAIRYRPGQRHVLRVEAAEPGRAAYLKVYRDDTGAAALERARVLRASLDAWGGPATVVPAAGYLPRDRVAVWEEVVGPRLGDVVVRRPDLAALAGAVLRVLHDATPAATALPATSLTTEVATATRATAHVVALSAAARVRVPHLLDTLRARLADLPGEPAAALHGDYKCDNVVVADDVLHLMDLDRAGAGDPAVDLGKMASDLRWHAARAGGDGTDLVAAFLAGYGPSPRSRVARAACYEALFGVRAAGRRVPLTDPAWEDAVLACVDRAETVLAEVPA